MKNGLLALMTLIAAASIVGNVVLYERYSSHRTLFVVNGDAISRKDLDDRVDFLYSKELLRKMIWTKLVEQEATKKHCLPTDKDVKDAIAKIDRENPTATNAAREIDPTLTLFKRALRAELAIRNLEVQDVHLTPAQVDEFYAKHKALFALPPQSQTLAVVAQDSVACDVAKSLLAQGVTTDVIAETNGLKVVGRTIRLVGQLPGPVSQQVLSLRPGEIGVYKLGKKFLVVKILSVAAAGVQPLDKIRAQVEMAARLAHARTQADVLADIRRRANIVVDSEKYAAAVPPIQSQSFGSAAMH